MNYIPVIELTLQTEGPMSWQIVMLPFLIQEEDKS